MKRKRLTALAIAGLLVFQNAVPAFAEEYDEVIVLDDESSVEEADADAEADEILAEDNASEEELTAPETTDAEADEVTLELEDIVSEDKAGGSYSDDGTEEKEVASAKFLNYNPYYYYFGEDEENIDIVYNDYATEIEVTYTDGTTEIFYSSRGGVYGDSDHWINSMSCPVDVNRDYSQETHTYSDLTIHKRMDYSVNYDTVCLEGLSASEITYAAEAGEAVNVNIEPQSQLVVLDYENLDVNTYDLYLDMDDDRYRINWEYTIVGMGGTSSSNTESDREKIIYDLAVGSGSHLRIVMNIAPLSDEAQPAAASFTLKGSANAYEALELGETRSFNYVRDHNSNFEYFTFTAPKSGFYVIEHDPDNAEAADPSDVFLRTNVQGTTSSGMIETSSEAGTSQAFFMKEGETALVSNYTNGENWKGTVTINEPQTIDVTLGSTVSFDLDLDNSNQYCRLTAPEDGEYELTMNAYGMFSVYNGSTGEQVYNKTSDDNGDGMTTHVYEMTAGDYYVMVDHYDIDSATYEVTFAERPCIMIDPNGGQIIDGREGIEGATTTEPIKYYYSRNTYNYSSTLQYMYDSMQPAGIPAHEYDFLGWATEADASEYECLSLDANLNDLTGIDTLYAIYRSYETQTLSAGQDVEVDLSEGEGVSFEITPKESGEYYFYTSNLTGSYASMALYDADGIQLTFTEQEESSDLGFPQMLEAGQTYYLKLKEGPITGSVSVRKMPTLTLKAGAESAYFWRYLEDDETEKQSQITGYLWVSDSFSDVYTGDYDLTYGDDNSYMLDGWALTPNGEALLEEELASVQAGTTLYATWVKRYPIHLNAGDEGYFYDEEEKEYWSYSTASDGQLTIEKWSWDEPYTFDPDTVFIGWALSEEDAEAGKTFAGAYDLTKLEENQPLELYAVYKTVEVQNIELEDDQPVEGTIQPGGDQYYAFTPAEDGEYLFRFNLTEQAQTRRMARAAAYADENEQSTMLYAEIIDANGGIVESRYIADSDDLCVYLYGGNNYRLVINDPGNDNSEDALRAAVDFNFLNYKMMEVQLDAQGQDIFWSYDHNYDREIYTSAITGYICTEVSGSSIAYGEWHIAWETERELGLQGWSRTADGETLSNEEYDLVSENDILYAVYRIHNHEWYITDQTQPDCGNAGVVHYACKGCEQTDVDVIPPTGNHTWNAGVVTTAATSTATGVKTYTCTVCGKTKTETIPVIAAPAPVHTHSWNGGAVTTEATAVSEGVKTFTCTGCGQTRTEQIAKLPAFLNANASSLKMQLKQKSKALKVEMQTGDSVISWISSNTKVLKVSGSSNGTCTLKAQKKAGTAKVVITLASGLTKTITVKVGKAKIKTSKVKLVGLSSKITLAKGKTQTIQTALTPITSQDKVTYTSSNSKVVKVSKKGVIKAVKKGKAKITVKAGKKKAVITVTVQ